MSPSNLVLPSTDTTAITLIDPVSVTVEGTTVVFARKAEAVVDTLYYNVREPDAEPMSPREWSGWSPLSLTQPSEPSADRKPMLRLAGMDLITVDSAATTPTPADAPFRVVTDGRHVCCLRRSTGNSLYLDRFVLVQNPEQRPSDPEEEQPTRWQLQRLGEIRYRRSGRRDVPAGDADSLGSTNMAGEPFLEPTIELSLLLGKDITDFDVALGPTSEMDLHRWHLVTRTADGTVSYLSCKEAEFDPMDLRESSVHRFTVPLAASIAGARVPLAAAAGPAVAVYAEQERAKADENATTVRRGMRLAMTVPVEKQVAPGDYAGLAVLDLTMFEDGSVAEPAPTLECVVIDSGAGDKGYPVPSSAVHSAGAGTATAVLLTQPELASAPALLDSADGLLHCYFAQRTSTTRQDFAVARFDPIMVRAQLSLPWSASDGSTGTFPLIAQRSGTTFNGATVAVADCAAGTAPDLCSVSISYGAESGLPDERWEGVPRALSRMVPILNGRYSQDCTDVEVRSGERQFYDADGRFPSVRLPMTPDVTGAAGSAFLELFSTHEEVPIKTVEVSSASGGPATMTIHYALPGGGTAKQTWAALPQDTHHLVGVLTGEAAMTRYSYTPATDDTPLYALDGGILVFGRAGKQITLTVAAGKDPEHCTLGLTEEDTLSEVANDVSRAPAAVAEVLRTWLPGVLVDGMATRIGDQVVDEELDLRSGSLLFDVLLPAPEGQLVPGTVEAMRWHRRTVIGNLPPKVALDRGMIALAAGAPVRVPPGQEALAGNSNGAVVVKGSNGTWRVAHQSKALTLNGSTAVEVPTPGSAVVPVRDWTVESWVRPTTEAPAMVVAYDGGRPAETGVLPPHYFLSTGGMRTVEFESYTTKDDKTANSYLEVAKNQLFDPTRDAFTWEAWVRPAARPCMGNGCLGSLFQVYDTEDSKSVPLIQLGLGTARLLRFGYRTDKDKKHENVETIVGSGDVLPANAWSHVAVTARKNGSTWALQLYVNAKSVFSSSVVLRAASKTTPPGVVFGSRISPHVSMFGSVTEVRFWTTARSAADLGQTMRTSLTGSEPNLAGYWPLNTVSQKHDVESYNYAEATGEALNAHWKLNPAQKVVLSDHNPFIGVITKVSDARAVYAKAFLEKDTWNHVAVAYRGTGALRLNQGAKGRKHVDYGICKQPTGFDFGDQFTVEAWTAPTHDARPHGMTILAQWGVDEADQSFQFGYTGSGTAFCAVNLVDTSTGKRVPLRVESGSSVSAHLAAVLRCTMLPPRNAKDKPDVKATLSLYVNSQKVASESVTVSNSTQLTSTGSRSPLTLGVRTPPSPTTALESQLPFDGAVTGVRFWSVGLSDNEMSAAMTQRDTADTFDGVVSAWWFHETTGTVAADSRENNDMVLSSADLWGSMPFLGRYSCYHNGRRVDTIPAKDEAWQDGFDPQLSIGAVTRSGSYDSAFSGSLAELRLWRSARTRAEVVDGLYRPIAADNPDLAAYWSFDGTAKDLTGRGADGTVKPPATYTASTAPVADEGPQVRDVYNGPVTAFQRNLTGRPSVLEYPETATRWDGRPIGVMRRAYFFTAPELVLATGFGVGELDLVYLGQVQTNPTLIGFIEGAPPVPSENLSRPLYNSPLGYNNYQDASTVALRSTETSSFTFSSTDYRTKLRMNLDVKQGGSGGLDMSTGFYLPGTGFEMKNALLKLKLAAHHRSDLEMAQQTDRVDGSTWTKLTGDGMGLRGRWEPPATKDSPYLNPVVGRRYQPLNVGYALVESLTADLYALRLDTTGAMVGKVVLPDLNIPPDRNIVTFRMRSTYVKNGTLDGRVGLVNDPDFPQADVTRGSYFRPEEAYRLAARIERSDQLLRARYRKYEAEDRGTRGPVGPDTGDVTTGQFYDFRDDVPTRGIANRYVWTATGGLHTETEQFSSVHERSYAGFYDYTFVAGLEGSYEGQFGPSWRAGAFGSFDALFGGHLKIQVGKKENQGRGLTLDITCPGDPMLQAYDDPTATYTTDPCPGKVEAYRFMAFYLPPSADNGSAFHNDVVDRDWLRSSSDPDAVALRNVRHGGNGVWRVLYRVTYVNRVPPRFDTNPAQVSGPAPEQTIMLVDNPLLIELVDQAMPPGRQDPEAVGNAVATVLTEVNGSAPYTLSAKVPWWKPFVQSARATAPDIAAAHLLNQIVDDATTYFQAGYASGALPLPRGGERAPAFVD
ncbi:LamG domain-containing protein [Allokutzneria oryzae]|uniref:LamG-like jellyroll fold domain-containing protein n=1 Tax=Allokutzneria oryzae TaxID=1378989 RepID=A0ABV5ZX85_9PSEU